MEAAMGHLDKLNVTQLKRPETLSPAEQRRAKLIAKLEEQLAVAQAVAEGKPHVVQKQGWTRDNDGNRQRVVSERVVRPWWWPEGEGVCLVVRYGAKILELGKGKRAINVSSPALLPGVLNTLIAATKSGELDAAITTAKPTELLIIGAQIAKWYAEQITGNIVAVANAGSVERFVLLPNGTYNAPIGSASVLTGSPSRGFTLRHGDGTTLTFGPASYTTPAKITQWTNAAGAALNFQYNGSFYLTSVANPATSRQLNFHYTGNQLTSVDDNTGTSPRTITFGYDSSNDLTAITDPLGFATTYSYASPGQLTNIYYPTHPANPFVTMTYDTLGRPNVQWDAAGNATNLYFAGARTEIDDPAGTAHVSYADPFGRTLASIDGLGSAGINSGNGNLTTYSYDGLERVSTATLPEGNATSYTYDSYSNPLTVVQTPKPGSPLSPLTASFTYTSPVAGFPNFEKVSTATDPLGLVSTYSYDANGNRITAIADTGSGHFNATTRLTYDNQGRVQSVTNPIGTTQEITYDSFGDPISIVADYGVDCSLPTHVHLCQTTQFSYDPVGNALTTTDPNGHIATSTFDADRRLTSLALPPAPLSLQSTYSYDPDGRLLQTQQYSGSTLLRSTSTSYTLTGKQATTTDANGNVTRDAYDNVDRLSQVTDAAGRITTFTYDALSRQYQTLNTAIQSQPLLQFAYTPNGKPASLTDGHTPTGNTSSFAYDGLDRLATTTYPDSSTEQFAYDADGNLLTKQTRAGQTITRTYDTLNRLSTKAAPGEATATYTYDIVGHMTGVGDNSSAFSAVPSGSASYAVGYTYDALNRPTLINWPNVTAQTTPTAASATFTNSYDPTNRRSIQSASDNTWLAYPAATASTIGYTANTLNQYSAVGSVTPTYDGNGNLTYDGAFTYAYDAESRLTSIKQGATTIATYLYDAQGRRKSKAVGATTTVYTTDADNREVLENDGTSGQVQQWYAYGSGIDEPLNQMALTASTRVTFIPDIQGSVMATLDAASGTLTKAAYLPFGENAANYSGTFRYTSRRIDPETGGSTAQPSGLYYYRARMYSPTWGRFLQADPVGYAAGPNLYTYVGNDPLNAKDPNGKDPFIGATVGLIAGAIYGGLGAAILPGASWKSIAAGAAAGGLVGAGVGALDPSLGVATLATVGGVAGGAGDLAGQAATNYLKGAAPLSDINGAEIAGAVVGGAIGGALTPLLPAAGWAGTAAEAYATGAPALLTTTVGSLLGAQFAQPASTSSSASAATK
jgi:RHS repeat-associated protein